MPGTGVNIIRNIQVFLKNQKVFGLSRIFLLTAPLIAMVIPLLEIPVSSDKPNISLKNNDFFRALTQTEVRNDIIVTYGLPEFTVQSTNLPLLLEWKDYLIIGYLCVLIFLLGRFSWHTLQLRQLKEKGWYQTSFQLKGQYFLIPTFGMAPAFPTSTSCFGMIQ
ncbi:hypothetical protein [Echinicola jeungdonensis]|uniref:hypothetical protein n=1 Tax=Echinicola jeungdonensis TaxID=709343 RepID=UPI0036D2BC4D